MSLEIFKSIWRIKTVVLLHLLEQVCSIEKNNFLYALKKRDMEFDRFELTNEVRFK